MISICILNWNCLETLKKKIENILKIENLDYEIIVYDQNSNDGSKIFLQNLNESKIKVLLSNKNTGNCVSRNKMIEVAQYKYILLLDSDIVPIDKSIEKMVQFMEENQDFVFLGYDYTSYSDDWNNVTKEEREINLCDVMIWKHQIALTQYGIFKKSILKDFPFPEFYPFDCAGWGGEDDVVGKTIFQAKIGKAGTIKNRIYFHNKGSSIPNLGEDYFLRTYMIRFNYLMYFDTLSLDKKIESLRNKKISITKLRCNKYHWAIQDNLGDVATDIILHEYFPFLEFDKNEKSNLLMFGGTIFNHIENANKLHDANFTNILYYGVGVSQNSEIDHALKMIVNNNVNFEIVPRGSKTKDMLSSKGVSAQSPVGDVLQLLSSMPIIETNPTDPELLVFDIWNPNLIYPKNKYETIKVANDKKSFLNIPFCDYKSFFDKIKNFSKIYSSQVHPFLISALLGKPCNLHQKDWRAEDFRFFKSFKLEMNKEDCFELRKSAQRNIQKFSYSFFDNIKRFI